jgi:heat shock protein HspQ
MIMPRTPTSAQDQTPSPLRFGPGVLVRHRRYGYRGVVVSVDTSCEADEAWYQKNMTQPDRSQPWCHVLVHNSGRTTYAAQENLESDESGQPIEHPLVDTFFSDFWDGRYQRNDRPWPS